MTSAREGSDEHEPAPDRPRGLADGVAVVGMPPHSGKTATLSATLARVPPEATRPSTFPSGPTAPSGSSSAPIARPTRATARSSGPTRLACSPSGSSAGAFAASILDGGALIRGFIREGLDEMTINVVPLVLGFRHSTVRECLPGWKLKLIEAKSLASGLVQIRYQREDSKG